MAPVQLNIFNYSSLHTVVRDVKEALNAEVEKSGKSRDKVLDRVNELAKRHRMPLTGQGGLSKALFEKYLNPEDESRVPGLKALVLICAALETSTPLAVIATALGGGQLIGPEEARLLEWARAHRESKRLRQKMRRLEEDM
ncbi:hypothetical protein [Desulfobulbus elongatus]|uniref:hypothetical protein n=1 Tax=Desulfobulbus elongatus TaxID=53332 RepID=UPI00048A1F77|nr:hypothetical protein [Desulfobulbus elongatus]